MVEDVTTWRLDHVDALHDRYLAGNYDFGLGSAEFSEICRGVTSEDHLLQPLVASLWPRFSNGSEVNVLELISALAVGSSAETLRDFLIIPRRDEKIFFDFFTFFLF